MKLPIPFINRKKNASGYYLALLLTDEKISSVILVEEFGKIKIVGKHQEHLSTPLESLEQDELISLVDKTISRAEEILPPNIETHKTVFGVKEKWVEKESKKINKEHLAKLKKVCDALDLTPIGFMVISEAIANLIQSEEGAPLSAILVEMGKKSVHATLFRGGQISESASGHVEHSLPATVDTLLKQFTAPVLPAKIILSHTSESKNISQHFLSHEWSKSLPFLHVPQISVLPEDFDAKAVAVGAANQMGFEILGIADTTLHELSAEHKAPDDLPDELVAPPPSEITSAGDNFGFVTNEDIANQPVQKHFVEKVVENEKNLEVYLDEQSDQSTEKISHTNENFNEIIDSKDENEPHESNTSRRKQKLNFASLISRIPKVALPKTLKLPKFLKNKGAVIPLAIVGVLLIAVVGITAFYFYNVKAEIILSVKPKEVTQVEAISISTTSGNDFSEKIIAGKSVSIEVNGEATTDATGKKDTGNKAKGSVTIYNSADSKASLSSGTAIKSSNGLTFTLDKDVDLASASGDIFTGTKPGTAQVGVTAKDIGTESNLPSATKFSIGGNSSLAAKNDSAFSGGSKKVLNVVSKKDIDKLRTDLPESLEKKAEEELAGKKTADEIILPTLISSAISNEKFDKDVDDEAKQLKLTATVSFEGISYNKSDLLDFEKSVLKDKYSEDISFAENAITNEISAIKVNKNKGIDANLKITAGLLPKIDNTEVVNKLKDKSSKEAKQILSTLPQVTKSEIKYSPNIFFLSGIFPRLPKNIIVSVKSE
ncbi:MAG TPA: baseplate J/gp47 family protein [Candidatus Limnocylindrales bacterium]|nr:baseplate J/gp47 family protein [Candidatus Limnocylindrales bacterium]